MGLNTRIPTLRTVSCDILHLGYHDQLKPHSTFLTSECERVEHIANYVMHVMTNKEFVAAYHGEEENNS
jgi:hypothetical protein